MRRGPHFTKLDLREDPLKGAYGLSWFERKPSSLSRDEWAALDKAANSGLIDTSEYFDWKANVR